MKLLIFFSILLISLPLFSQVLVDPPSDSDNESDFLAYLQNLTKEELIQEALQLNENVLRNGGGWTGTGGDFHLENTNIWYAGNTQIPYCIEVANDYPMTHIQVSDLVKESIED